MRPRNTPDQAIPLGIPAGPTHPLAKVWHIVLRSSSKPLRPERLATFVLPPDELARFGLRKVEAAVMQARSQWAGLAIRAGYVGPEWTVEVVRETGFVKSLFPGAAIAGAPEVEAAPAPALVLPGGKPDA